jgi:hypothetical protein
MYGLIYTLTCYLTMLFTGSTRKEVQRAYAYNRTHSDEYTYHVYRNRSRLER